MFLIRKSHNLFSSIPQQLLLSTRDLSLPVSPSYFQGDCLSAGMLCPGSNPSLAAPLGQTGFTSVSSRVHHLLFLAKKSGSPVPQMLDPLQTLVTLKVPFWRAHLGFPHLCNCPNPIPILFCLLSELLVMTGLTA